MKRRAKESQKTKRSNLFDLPLNLFEFVFFPFIERNNTILDLKALFDFFYVYVGKTLVPQASQWPSCERTTPC